MAERGWQAWAKEHANNILRVAVVLLFLLLAVWALSLSHFELVIAHSEPWLWLTNALIEVGPELAGIVIGVVTIDYLNERRQTEQLKAQLIRQMGMNIRDVAVPAARELAHHGWLYDGSLRGANLMGADLSGASLSKANLSGARLVKANLSGAWLVKANLSQANLWDADLSGAWLMEANLSGVWRWTIEQLAQAKILQGAIMPDEVQLGDYEGFLECIDGPTFEEWKALYLARQKAERAEDKPDDTANVQAESGSPGPI